MQRERLHEKRLAGAGVAGVFAVACEGGGDCGAFIDSVEVTAGGNAERSVGVVAIVEVETDGEEGFEDFAGRPGVIDAVFD